MLLAKLFSGIPAFPVVVDSAGRNISCASAESLLALGTASSSCLSDF